MNELDHLMSVLVFLKETGIETLYRFHSNDYCRDNNFHIKSIIYLIFEFS